VGDGGAGGKLYAGYLIERESGGDERGRENEIIRIPPENYNYSSVGVVRVSQRSAVAPDWLFYDFRRTDGESRDRGREAEK
jgi:hypothetical protein